LKTNILTKMTIIGLMILFTGCVTNKTDIVKVPPKAKQVLNKKDKKPKPSFFEIQRKKELSKVITQKSIPIKTADKVMRVLIFPYVDEKDIYQSENFHFITVEKGKWVFAEYPADVKNSVKEFTPLKTKKKK